MTQSLCYSPQWCMILGYQWYSLESALISTHCSTRVNGERTDCCELRKCGTAKRAGLSSLAWACFASHCSLSLSPTISAHEHRETQRDSRACVGGNVQDLLTHILLIYLKSPLIFSRILAQRQLIAPPIIKPSPLSQKKLLCLQKADRMQGARMCKKVQE